MTIATIANNEAASSVRAKLNAILNSVSLAESWGFVQGTGLGTEAGTNLTAWNTLMGSGGFVYFGPGTWDMRFAGTINGVAANVTVAGAGKYATTFLGAGSLVYFKLLTGSVNVEEIYWDFGATPMTNSAGHLVDFESKTADIDLVRVVDCRFRNIFNVFWAPTTGANLFFVREMVARGNICENRYGFARFMRSRCHFAIYERNYIDLNIGVPFGGPSGAYGGIIHGYVQDDAPLDGQMPEDTGEVHVLDNIIRNIKPTTNPGSPGIYGIQTQSYSAVIRGNRLEKIYPFFGTARTGEALFTGDGTTLTFTGTLAHFVTPDSFKVITAGNTIADDNDHGWARNAAARQDVIGTGVTGWVDYNTKAWSLTFAVAPTNATAYTASYIEGDALDQIEPIYAKSTMSRIVENSIFECGSFQGAICSKGGGSFGWDAHPPLAWQGSGGSQYGCTIIGNVIRNRAQTTVFSQSLGIWVQQDFVSIIGNIFEGLCDRLARVNLAASIGYNLIFSNNQIKDHFGSSIVYTAGAFTNIVISGNVIDGFFGTNTSGNLYLARLNGATAIVKNVWISDNVVSERITAGRNVVCAFMNSSTGSNDVVVNGFKCLAPWYGFQKAGTGTGGRARLMNHCLDQMVAVSLLDAASNAVANMTNDGGFA